MIRCLRPSSLVPRRRCAGLALAAALAVSLLPHAPGAAVREVVLEFLPPVENEISGYQVYVTDEVVQAASVIDVGYVAPDSDGVARTVVLLEGHHSHLVAMTAYNGAGESPLSNQIQIPPDACDPSLCDDGNPCTADSCGLAGCANTALPDGSSCDDGFADTLDDQCVAGLCEGIQLACSQDFDCDDGDVCNGVETCGGGTECFAGVPLDCGPPTQCAIPTCDAQEGCALLAVPDGTPCDDGLAGGGACANGQCVGVAGVSVAIEGVDPGTLSPGKGEELAILGFGFTEGATLQFENGQGPAPRVRELLLVDDRRLEARVEVSRKGPKRPRVWDVVVTLPDGSVARLPNGLWVDP